MFQSISQHASASLSLEVDIKGDARLEAVNIGGKTLTSVETLHRFLLATQA